MDAFRGGYPETIIGLYAHVQIRHGVDLPEYILVPEQSAPTTQKHHHPRAEGTCLSPSAHALSHWPRPKYVQPSRRMFDALRHTLL